MNRRATFIATLSALSLAAVLSASAWDGAQSLHRSTLPAAVTATDQAQTSYIVEAPSLAAAIAAVHDVGGEVTREFEIIDAVAANLTAAQRDALPVTAGLQVTEDRAVKTMGGPMLDTYQRVVIGADRLGAQGYTGAGVTVAILDTGLWYSWGPIKYTLGGTNRIKAMYNAVANKVENTPDKSGHGTHVTSIIASSNISDTGQPQGIAPNVNLVGVQAFGEDGSGSYASVITGLNWILTNKATHNIRVVNLSFGATPQSFYWNDPLNKAVMKLWQAGIVVVASAGNWGPYAQSITVPGNVPYVITVGAMTNNYSTGNAADDRLASFSSTGPTYEGFVKPELVAPGGHLVGIMDDGNHAIAKAHPEFATPNDRLYTMSGTSQAAAVVSGAVALMLQAQPTLTPNQVKCKLMSSARPAVDATSKLAYTVFQQGAGQINVYDAVYKQNTTCANVGLDLAADLAGTRHYGGPAHQKADGTFYIVDATGKQINQQGYIWNNGYVWNQGYIWNQGYVWNNGYIWSNGYLWNNGYVWNNGVLWNQSFVPSTTSVSGVNHWVDQE